MTSRPPSIGSLAKECINVIRMQKIQPTVAPLDQPGLSYHPGIYEKKTKRKIAACRKTNST